MNESFRLRNAIRVQGLLSTLFFAAAALGSAAIPLLPNPEQHGFAAPNAAERVAALGVAVFGMMTILGAFLLTSYYRERVSIAGSRAEIRTAFRCREFDVADIEALNWRPIPLGGRLQFIVPGRKINLDLHGFGAADRLQMIRLFRRLIPAEKQLEWPMFCHKIALPLRERLLPQTPRTLAESCPGDQFVLTRRRYDVCAAVLVPAALMVGVAVWRLTGAAGALALPLCMIFFWLFLRYSLRPQGERCERLTALPGWRTLLLGAVAIVGTKVLLVSLQLAGVEPDTACTAALVFLAPIMPLFLYGMWRAEKQAKRLAALSALTAPERWDAGESPAHGVPLAAV